MPFLCFTAAAGCPKVSHYLFILAKQKRISREKIQNPKSRGKVVESVQEEENVILNNYFMPEFRLNLHAKWANSQWMEWGKRNQFPKSRVWLSYFFTCLFSRISHSTRTVGAAREWIHTNRIRNEKLIFVFLLTRHHIALWLSARKKFVLHDFDRSNLSIEREWWNMKSHHDATRRSAVFPGNCRRSTPNRNNNHYWQYRVSCRRCNAIENRESMSLSSFIFHCVNFSILCGYADIPSLHFAPLQLILNFSSPLHSIAVLNRISAFAWVHESRCSLHAFW